MRRLPPLIACLLLLAGCHSPRRLTEAEQRGFERGLSEAVREQYWAIQHRQRPAAGSSPSTQP